MKPSTNADERQAPPSEIQLDTPLPPVEAPPTGSPSCLTFDVGSFAIVRHFVEHIMGENASALSENGERTRFVIDWEAVEASVANSRTLEQAIGRAVLIADQASRGLRDGYQLRAAPSWPNFEDPFFAFSMVDVLPDFGDGRRYRSRVRRKVARIFGTRREVGGIADDDSAEAPEAAALVGHDDPHLATG
jgi:hypothetical protein